MAVEIVLNFLKGQKKSEYCSKRLKENGRKGIPSLLFLLFLFKLGFVGCFKEEEEEEMSSFCCLVLILFRPAIGH